MNTLGLLRDLREAKKHAPGALEARQRARLSELVTHARTSSPYYRRLYRGLPDQLDDPAVLPVTNRRALMEHFDEWVTDPDVTLDRAHAFVDDPGMAGQRFLGKYWLATSSGSSGTLGIFVMDDRTKAVYVALSVRMIAGSVSCAEVARTLAAGARTAMVFATGGHFSSSHVAPRSKRNSSKRNSRWGREVFSLCTPLPRLVEQLNRFRPAILAGYASVIAQLATEQSAGRLHVHPVLVQPSSEGLALGEYDRVAEAFDAKVRYPYGATEFNAIGINCAHKWLHVNNDWVILEPVDTEHRPVPAGEQSHTVLLTNLVTRVQPILRYDLGDSVLVRPDPCPCGNPLPAIRVQGRAADTLTFPARDGNTTAIPPLVFNTLIEGANGLDLFQIVQTAPARLRVRVRPTQGTNPETLWAKIHADITTLLATHELDHVTVEQATEPPEQSPGGKYRRVVPFDPRAGADDVQ